MKPYVVVGIILILIIGFLIIFFGLKDQKDKIDEKQNIELIYEIKITDDVKDRMIKSYYEYIIKNNDTVELKKYKDQFNRLNYPGGVYMP